ncbi:DUF4133 domain-containing protein [Chryseobacterium caseinilyticum]|uniref:DUF4133 domain-containing protein n=1 Tax=Chryseobacterium caseinilyticum TaxID=2771428 RepID=A0ABR8ZGZ2_9FLAO|nr:DUF4133 domain-containing protein [Chryseobacterium caseinilyticum]MBD8084574.1 DUF4133 domain-containing protein [Chryseobacterium caseinilyticum]
MNTYHINKGIGRTVEFKGLKAQYLFIFAGGLLGLLVLVMILYMAGVNTYICLSIGGISSSLLVWQTFSLNRKYGEHGLMKLGARKKHPRYIISRKSIFRYSRINSKKATA